MLLEALSPRRVQAACRADLFGTSEACNVLSSTCVLTAGFTGLLIWADIPSFSC